VRLRCVVPARRQALCEPAFAPLSGFSAVEATLDGLTLIQPLKVVQGMSTKATFA